MSKIVQNFFSAQYLENELIEFYQILYRALILTRSRLVLLPVIFCKFATELWPLIYVRILIYIKIWILVSAQYLANTLTEFYQILYICFHIDKIYVGIVTHHFSHFCTRVIVLDWSQNLISTQYVENNIEHWYWQDLGWDCYLSFFANLWQGYGPWIISDFRFCSISWEWIDRISPNFVGIFDNDKI